MGTRTYTAEAVVLRSLRYGEADRILHLFTRERGRVGAIAKGARRTRSRFGARLEPFSHVEVMLHQGRGDLSTVTGAHLLRAHHGLAADPYRTAVGWIGLEAVLRLFIEHDASPQAFHALVRFLDLLDDPAGAAAAAGGPEPGVDELALSFQLKLLWLAGYLPHLASCAACGGEGPLVGFSARAGGAVCASCPPGAAAVSAEGLAGARALLERPLGDARGAGLSAAAARQTLRLVEAVYAEHGGFRLRTLARRGPAVVH